MVRAENGFAYGAVGADIHVFGDGVPLYLLETWRPAPQTDPEFLRDLPSRMLNARFAVVDFTGRRQELADLHRWRQEGPRLAARWLHAPGGQGKTRLAAQFAQESRADGWKVITAVHGPGTVLPPPGSQDLRLDGAVGLLVIVDYADRWPLSHLTWLFSNALLHQSAVRTRILMLARSADTWPAIRATLANQQAGASAQPLPPLPDNDDGARLEMFTAARDSFASHYDAPATGISPPGPLDHPDFGLTLAVHIAALVAVDAYATGQRPPSDMGALTIYLLDREHLHWAQLYSDGTHELNPTERTYATPPEVMNQTVFAAALTGSLTRPAGTTVLEALQFSTPAERVIADHAICYPRADLARDTVLEPLYPDRLAEDFLALTLPGHGSDYPTHSWAARTTSALLTRDRQKAPSTWAPRAITFLATAAARWPHLGPHHLYPLLRNDPGLAVYAGSAALTALAALQDAEPALLMAIESHFPPGRHVNLDMGIASLSARLAAYRLAKSNDLDEQVEILQLLAIRFSNAGLREDALQVMEQATVLCRRMAAADPTVSDDRLATALNNLGNRLLEVGRREDALTVTLEATEQQHSLAKKDPTVHTAGYALALMNLGNRYSQLGYREKALAATQESMTLYRNLTRQDPAIFEQFLARTLGNLGNQLARLGRQREALSATQEAIDLCRRLAASQPGGHEPDLAMYLNNLGGHLRVLGLPGAVEATRESVDLRRRMVSGNPSAFEPGLATALTNLSSRLSCAGQYEEALLAAQEAVELYRQLAKKSPAVHEVGLATALSNMGGRLLALGRYEEAVTASREAVALQRRLASGDPQTYEPGLASSLNNLGNRLAVLGRRKEAQKVIRESADLLRRLAVANSTAHGPALDQVEQNLRDLKGLSFGRGFSR
ncbi:tetratricopeptide repeat protein [Actinomadura luteofluorescens]|uniref:tetratricopeptide repeat protein n=1 Tax=Actinomadura luteofluorescens TaxID=46163 RepID=UPI00347A5C13